MEGFEITEAPAVEGLEPTETNSGSAETETPSAETTEASTETETASGETETPEGVQPEGQQDNRLVVDGHLSPAAKTALEKLKAENPALAAQIRKALFAEERFRRELPGGFKEVQELRERIEQLGGETGIQELQQETNGWREFDALYTAGDPKVLEFLTETPEAKDAFLRIAPAAFEKFREANPEGYAGYIAQVFVSDMMEHRVPLILERLYDVLPQDNPRAKEVADQLVAYVNRLSQLSKNPVAPAAAPKAAQQDQRADELTRREQNLTRTEWGNESAGRHTAMFRDAWKQQIGDRKLSSDQTATIRELYGLKLAAILKAKPDFNANLERYFSSSQKDGFLRYFESVYREAVPRALRAAVTQAGIGAKPGPKPPAPGQQKPPQKPGAKPAPAGGFQFVNAKPEMGNVDRTQTTPDMWLAGKAVLKTGQRVQWKR